MTHPIPEPLLDVFWHDDVLFHDTGHGVYETKASPLLMIQTPHPEGPDRITNMKSILQRGPIAPHVAWHAGRHATEEELLTFHEASYIAEVKRAAHEGRQFTATTLLRPGAWPGLLTGAGTSIEACRQALKGERPTYALVRPPGHHAAPAMADGYAFFNHVALAAEHALANGIRRVAIVDWDVHHGNGIQEGFYSRDDVLTVSMHMDHGAWGPSHTQTGKTDEQGKGTGIGFNLNVPLPMGSSDHAHWLAFDRIVAPKIRAFAPELLIIAHGVDASQFDPNGRQLVTMNGFHGLARRARLLADELCSSRMLIVQEGGYNPAYAAFCVHASMEGFTLRDASLPDPLAYMPQAEARSEADVGAIESMLSQ